MNPAMLTSASGALRGWASGVGPRDAGNVRAGDELVGDGNALQRESGKAVERRAGRAARVLQQHDAAIWQFKVRYWVQGVLPCTTSAVPALEGAADGSIRGVVCSCAGWTGWCGWSRTLVRWPVVRRIRASLGED